MDLGRTLGELQKAREVLEAKGAPLEGTAVGHVILALEDLVMNLDNSFGYTKLKKFEGLVDDALRQSEELQARGLL